MIWDDDFTVRPGPPKDVGVRSARRARSYVSRVLQAVRATSGGTRDFAGRPTGGPRSERGALIAKSTWSSTRRVVIKARIVRHQGARFRAAPLAMHLRYLKREGVTLDERPAEMFGRVGPADGEAFAVRCEEDRHHFRFIVSPEDAAELENLEGTARDLMLQMERDLHTRLDWVAVGHWNTDNPHVHILVRGRTDDGADLVVSRDYISWGLRERAQAIVSLELGPRTQAEIAASLNREVTAERWTSLDRDLRSAADQAGGLVDLRPVQGRDEKGVLNLIGRAQILERLGLAQAEKPGVWTLRADLEPTLRALGERGDIIKTLHRSLGRPRDPSDLAIHAQAPDAPLVGKLVDRGLHDELTGQAYLVVDGVDGRLHHLRLPDLAATGDTPAGGLVEVRQRPSDGRVFVDVLHRSDLSLDRQVTAGGATWLDRQLVGREPEALAHHGFGLEVRDALKARTQQLLQRGMARRRAGVIDFQKDLLGALRRDEIESAGSRLAERLGRPLRASTAGEAIAGVYRERVSLASGRFAMIDDGLGFQLVPWTRSLDQHLGREVRGVMGPGGGVDWTFGRKRGLGL